MRSRAPLPESWASAFRSADAGSEGWTTAKLDRPDLLHPFHGVRARPLEPVAGETLADTWRRSILHHARAFALVMTCDMFFSHRTAAIIRKLPYPDPQDFGDLELDVSVFRPRRAPRGRGVRGHQLTPSLAHVTRHDGLAVSSPASTWAMLGTDLEHRDLVALGDAIVHVPRIPGHMHPSAPPLATVDQLRAAIEAGRRVGVQALRDALPDLRTGSASRPESHARLLLVQSGLPEPALDVDVFDTRGRLLGCSELAYPEFKVAVEYEGDHHRVDRRQWNRDIDKYQQYAEQGWRPVRLTGRLLYQAPDEAARRVASTLRAAGWHG